MVDSRKLKARIVLAGFSSQAKLAEATGMSVNSLNAKINGRRVFNCDEVDVLCEALKIESGEEKADIFLARSSQKRDERA